MKHSIGFLLFIFLTATAFATPPDPLSKWTPKGWKRIALATGDLNADGIDDAAIVLDKTSRSQNKAGRFPPRRMLVLIGAGTLTLAFRQGTSCGSYDTSNEQFFYQLEGERLQLTGYELFQASRSSGEIEEIKVDYRQGTLRTSYGGNLFDDSQKARVRWEQLAVQLPLYLDEMSLNCDPEKVADMQSWCE